MSEVIFVCRECGTRIKQVFAGDDSGAWVSECGHVRGLWIDGGTLDLGLIDPDPTDENNFEIFLEPPA